MKKILFVLPVVALLSSCGVNVENATRVLESQGLTNVQITGFSLMGCGKDDSFASNFTAVGANGKEVNGTVCAGWFKGITVRFD